MQEKSSFAVEWENPDAPVRLRIVFFGTAELARPILASLIAAPVFEVAAVVTQPDRPAGRHLKLHPSPVKLEALPHSIPLLQPERARSEGFSNQIAEFHPDLTVVAAYGQILPQTLLDVPRFGCLNVHASLLPKYRGAAPIQWALLNGDSATGVTIMKMDAGLDTGDILLQQSTPILPEDDAATLQDRLSQMGAQLLLQAIPGFIAGNMAPRKQPAEGVSYARKIKKEDGRIDWTLPGPALINRIRALNPWPGTFTYYQHLGKTELLKISRAERVPAWPGEPGQILQAGKEGLVVACGEGALRILALQREGGRKLSAQEFLSGHLLKPGQKFIPHPCPGP